MENKDRLKCRTDAANSSHNPDGILLDGSITTELDKIFYYRSANDIWVDISFYENGVLKQFNQKKIACDNGNGKIGIVVNGRLKIIGKEQIKSIKIVEMHEVVREDKEKRIVLKRLKVNHDILTV